MHKYKVGDVLLYKNEVVFIKNIIKAEGGGYHYAVQWTKFCTERLYQHDEDFIWDGGETVILKNESRLVRALYDT